MQSGLTIEDAAALEAAYRHLVAYRQSVPNLPVGPRIDAAEVRHRFGAPLTDKGQSATEVIDALAAGAEPGLMQVTSPRFFGYVMGASHPVGVAADMLCSAWGQPSAYAALTPSTVTIENIVCEWIIELLGLPATSGAGLVTGATMANTVGVMAARNALLRRDGWDVEKNGLFGAPEIQVVVGAEAHSAIAGALRYAGFGAERVHNIPTDDQGRIDATRFAETLHALNGPVLVILQAGHVNSGAFDQFQTLIPLAHAKKAWVHVDGAFGLWLNAVPELRTRLMGVEDADSWAVDLHKWLNAPYDSGMVITRDRAALVASMSATGAYLPDPGAEWDMSDTVIELSRRARGVPAYAILRTLGRDGLREMIARHCRLAEKAAAAFAAEPGITVLNEIACNQVAITCGEGAEGDQMTKAVLARVHKNAKAYPSHGKWRGRQIIRISIIGHKAGDAEIETLIREIIEAWRSVGGVANG